MKRLQKQRETWDAETDMEAKRMYMEYIKGMYHLRHNVQCNTQNTSRITRSLWNLKWNEGPATCGSYFLQYYTICV